MMLHRSTAQRAGPAGRSAPHVPQLCPTLSRPRSHSRSYKTTTVSALEPERSPTSPTVATSAAAGASLTRDGASTVPTPPSVSPSANALLAALSSMGASPWAKNVYGKPFTNSELNALQTALSYVYGNAEAAAAAAGGQEALRAHLLELLLDAAHRKSAPLPVVEGAMVLLELMALQQQQGEQGVSLPGMTPEQQLQRWQLVVGADVGAVQYIPAVEELQVPPSGDSFTLGTDLDFLFTGFSGSCQWLTPGHLSYTVRQVRLELRKPKAWRRAAEWWAWRRGGGTAAPASGGADAAASAQLNARWAAVGALPTSETCREDPSCPATVVPLPFFPTNELKAFCCDGRVAATRSRLGGLILLLDVDTRQALRRRDGVPGA